MELLVMALVVGATGALILWPLLRGTESEEEAAGLPADRSREKELALAAIRELEFDYATGKISQEDYALLRARYEARALQAITRVATPPAATGGEPDVEALLEAEIAARRRSRRCASCGGSLPQEARYCPSCGAPARGEAPR